MKMKFHPIFNYNSIKEKRKRSDEKRDKNMMQRTDTRNLIFLFEISEKEKRRHEENSPELKLQVSMFKSLIK